MEVLNLGQIDFLQVLRIQEEKIRGLIAGSEEESIIICEHNPVLTFGYRMRAEDFLIDKEVVKKFNLELQPSDRGGAVTYHGPGQLVIYPIISLKKRNLGVKTYIQQGLEAIVDSLKYYDLLTKIRLDLPGVWTAKSGKKLAQVGIRINKGFTKHGFSLNISCNMDVFKYFKPCNLSADLITSMQAELEGFSASVHEVADVVVNKMKERFS